ncbi:MAG TPA: acyl-CoA dehydrogenase family protein [Streptosporangiaceae bacterium]|nr:acyl-CoA dehydrogenase family protein [Streptosporangiaceae bacterium]
MTSAAGWLAPLLPGVPGITDLDERRLHRFEEALAGQLALHPVGPDVETSLRSQRLARIRRELAAAGHLALAVPSRDGGAGCPPEVQALMQFICGYHDADLRDATGLGHGRLIARHASPPARDRWLPRLLAGDLPGIAITESHGGSQVHATATTATPHSDGRWRLSGTKTWISRLDEAAVFIVFFTDPAGQLTAGIIDAGAGGLDRHTVRPSGLADWSWGELRLDEVPLRLSEVLGRPGQGMDLLREHFAHYRPLVAATALGAAAAVSDHVAAHLCARRSSRLIADLRDNALITVGRSYAQINAALLAVLTAQRLSEDGDQLATLWGCAIKAHGVDAAHAAASELALLTGATGFTASSPLVKVLGDLSALRYADGIHDSLYRAAGRALTATSPAMPATIPLPRTSHEVHNRLHA